MADTVYEQVVAAHAAADHVAAVFPTVCRAADNADDGAFVTARFAADDGGAWLLKLSASEKPLVDMLYCVGDGGLPDGFVDDLCALCFECDLASPDALAPTLQKLLAKAALLYDKMNNSEMLDRAGDAGAASSPAAAGSGRSSGSGASSASAPARESDVAEHVEAAMAVAERERQTSRRRTVNYQPPEFAPSPLATATLTKQLQLLATADTEAMGFAVEPVGDNLYQWAVKMYYTDMETQLARDLQNHPTQKHVDMEFRFPAGYPCEPPFCRVVAPVFARGTGYVQSHGGICMELLTGSGWTPANSMDAVAVQIHSFLTAGKGRLDLITPGRVKDYTFAGALRDMSAIVNAHAWDVGNARVAKPRKRARGEDGDV